MQALALDVGEKRIGIAGTDPLAITAQPLATLHRTSPRKDYEHIARLAQSRGAQVLVVGLPRNMDGTLGFQGERVREFIRELTQILPLPVHWVDERLTTKAAHRTLMEGNMRRDKRKGVVDRIAAVYILEIYLSARHTGNEQEERT